MRKVALALVLLAACAKSYGTTDDVAEAGAPPGDADPDAGQIQPVPDLDAGDTNIDASGMVSVSTGARAFLIDRTEVTVQAFADFASIAGGFQQFPGCGYKLAPGPGPSCSPESAPNAAMTCVDWCDAVAYCAFQGKRLCGKIFGDGGVVPADAPNAVVAQWTRACSNSISAAGYPYGPDPNPNACNTSSSEAGASKALAVASSPKCVGGVAGLYDMSGNAAEWVDSCGGTDNGANDLCVTQGGSYFTGPLTCSTTTFVTRGTSEAYIGFRCCKDLP